MRHRLTELRRFVCFFFFGTKMIIKAKYTSATFKLSTFRF